jgi:hypothetical protein
MNFKLHRFAIKQNAAQGPFPEGDWVKSIGNPENPARQRSSTQALLAQ